MAVIVGVEDIWVAVLVWGEDIVIPWGIPPAQFRELDRSSWCVGGGGVGGSGGGGCGGGVYVGVVVVIAVFVVAVVVVMIIIIVDVAVVVEIDVAVKCSWW